MPRILTNVHNLPEQLVKAVQYDTHKMVGTISVTQLIDAPQVRLLKRQHTYEEDVSEALNSLLGTATHHILERANIDSVRKRAFILTAETIIREADALSAIAPDKANQLKNGANWIFSLMPVFFPELEERYIFERTLTLEVGSHMISGTFDLYDKATGILYDYKTTSIFSYIYPESRIKWKYQTNVYAYMLEKEGYPVNGIKVVALFRDWKKYDLMRDKEYPARNILEINIPLGDPMKNIHWTEIVKDYIYRRVELHERAERGENIPCTGEERWANADKFAVMKPGNKRALRVFDSKPAALGYIEENRHQYKSLSVEHRASDSKRCAEFCPVAKFCNQRKAELEKQAELLNQK